jgi:hypothetical protein
VAIAAVSTALVLAVGMPLAGAATPGGSLSGTAMSVASTSASGPFKDVVGFATKTGFRGVIAWSADKPVAGKVRYGTSPGALISYAIAPGAPDTAQLVIIDGLTIGQTYYYVVRDQLTGTESAVKSFKAANAYNNYDAAAGAYTMNLLVQLDSQSAPDELQPDMSIKDIAQAINVTAERYYDATDGNVRIGQVIVTDTVADNGPTTPGYLAADFVSVCETPLNKADVLVTTGMPMDSHTFGYHIADPCGPVYVGREAQLGAPWTGDLHFGYVTTHELSHYSLGAPDLYDGTGTGTGAVGAAADCRNLAWDGSLMHNTGGWVGGRWELTELDRNQILTPCPHGTEPYTWDTMRSRYTNVPVAGVPQDMFNDIPRGNPDGGAFKEMILDRGVKANSSLTAFTPDDSNPEIAGRFCSADHLHTAYPDVRGDAYSPAEVDTHPAVSDSNTDIVGVDVLWNGHGLELRIDANDLTQLPAPGSTGEWFDFDLNIDNTTYDVVAEWDRVDPTVTGPAFRATVQGTTGRVTVATLTGTWDLTRNAITISMPDVVAPAGTLAGYSMPAAAHVTGLKVTARRQMGAVIPDFDVAGGGCELILPGTVAPPPPPPGPDGTLSTSSPSYGWTGGPGTAFAEVPGGEVVENKLVDVVAPAAGGTVTVDLTASDPDVQDIDVRVYDAAGTLVKSSATGGGRESLSFPVTGSARYRIEVTYYMTAQATYTATATLT